MCIDFLSCNFAKFTDSVQLSSVTQLCPTLCDHMNCSNPGPPVHHQLLEFTETLCDPMNCSTPSLPVHHQLREFTQTRVHRVSDAIQPSHPLSSPSLPATDPSQHQRLFQWVNSASGGQSIGVSASASFLPKNTQDWSPLEQAGWISLCPRDSQESSPTPQFKSSNSSALSLLHSPTLTSIHDHWKNHSLD